MEPARLALSFPDAESMPPLRARARLWPRSTRASCRAASAFRPAQPAPHPRGGHGRGGGDLPGGDWTGTPTEASGAVLGTAHLPQRRGNAVDVGHAST